ncbi:MAG: hypothetical protein ABI315_14685 [Bacteroidia bacterium]
MELHLKSRFKKSVFKLHTIEFTYKMLQTTNNSKRAVVSNDNRCKCAPAGSQDDHETSV